MAALMSGTTCLPSPLNERATNEQPSASATAHGSIGWKVLTEPCFCTEPRSAVVFDEQQMPDIFASMCGSTPSSYSALFMWLVMELWPQPAHSVVAAPL